VAEQPATQYFDGLAKDKELRVGVGTNFEADREVSEAFQRAIETVRGFGYSAKSVAVPFTNPEGGLANIDANRKSIAGQTFKDIDVLLLPTTTTTVPAIRDVGVNPPGTLAQKYRIRQLLWFAGHQRPMRF
jgi:Asp-tRNA(Asn)/Glu-tRNA(Gln) amidotransferase A subunit family amidase